MRYSGTLILAFFINFAFGQTNEKRIKIISENEGLPLSGVNISLNKKPFTITDEDGIFQILSNNTKSVNTDSISFEHIGYSLLTISIKDLSNSNGIISLRPFIYNIKEVEVWSTKLSWGEIMYKAINGLNPQSLYPIESEIEKKIEVLFDDSLQASINLSGFSHDEGLDNSAILQNRNAFSWYNYNSCKINYLNKYSKFEKIYRINANTYLERRGIKLLLPLAIKYYNYSLNGIQKMESGDTVYIINCEPKNEYLYLLKTIDKKLNGPFYSVLLSKKTFFIRAKTYEIVRIDYHDNTSYSVTYNKKKLIKINGTIEFITKDKIIYPKYYKIQEIYLSDNTKITRTDNAFFKKIKFENLSNDSLKVKYNLSEINGSFPMRIFSQNNVEDSPYFFIPGIKF